MAVSVHAKPRVAVSAAADAVMKVMRVAHYCASADC